MSSLLCVKLLQWSAASEYWLEAKSAGKVQPLAFVQALCASFPHKDVCFYGL